MDNCQELLEVLTRNSVQLLQCSSKHSELEGIQGMINAIKMSIKPRRARGISFYLKRVIYEQRVMPENIVDG